MTGTMSTSRLLFGVVLTWAIVAFPGLAGAQAGAGAPAAPGESLAAGVLKQVPDDCMAFVVVKNVSLASTKLDDFIKAVKPSAPSFLPPEEAKNFEIPEIRVLDQLLKAGAIGEGFDRDGGCAMILMDRAKFPTDKPERSPGDPIQDTEFGLMAMGVTPVMLLPGKDPAKMLAAWTPQEDPKAKGVFKVVNPGDREVCWVRQAGSYVVLSASRKAMDAVAATSKSILARLTAAEQAFVLRNDVAAWASGATAEKFLGAVMKEALGPFAPPSPPQGDKPTTLPAGEPDRALFARTFLKQWQAMFGGNAAFLVGGRFSAAGVNLEARARTGQDSLVGKAVAALRPGGREMLGRLPMTQYAFAIAAIDLQTEDAKEKEKQMDLALQRPPVKDLPEAAKKEYRRIMLALDGQVQSIQLAAGPVASGANQVGLACVLECKSAAEMRNLLEGLAPILTEMAKNVKAGPFEMTVVRYEKGKAGVGGVDTATVDIPAISRMPDKDKQALTKVLGSDKLMLLISQTDAKTLVMTLGGGREFLALAARAADGTTPLAGDPAVAKALASVPPKRLFVALLDVANTWDVIKKIAETAGETDIPPLKLDTHKPIMAAGWAEGTDLCFRFDLPIEPARQVVQAVADAITFAFRGGREAGAQPPPPPPGDF